ncbi:MAG: FAD binding domain-containing protein [Thermoanaerobaculia bacterium]
MLRLPPFEFRVAGTVVEAAQILASEGPRARLVAGGTDLWPNMKRRHQKAEIVVSLMRIPELRGIRDGNGSGELRLGGTTILDEIVHSTLVRDRYPALARAVASISSPPLRNMGTIGGNVCVDTRCTYYNQTEEWRRSIDYCMKEEGSICWVAPSSPRCWAHSASDSAPILCALKAQVRLASGEGERLIPLQDLYRDDGIDYLGKRPEEIVCDILLPLDSDATHCRSSFWKLRRRGSIDFAVLSAAVAVWTEPDGLVQEARIFLGAVGSQPVPVTGATEFLKGKPLTEETISRAARFARKSATPMDNTDFQAQWRGLMAVKYTEAALREAAGLDPGRLAPNHL